METRRRVRRAILTGSLTARNQGDTELFVLEPSPSHSRTRSYQDDGAVERLEEPNIGGGHRRRSSSNSVRADGGTSSAGPASFEIYCNSRRVVGDVAILLMRLAVGMVAFSRFQALYRPLDLLIGSLCGAAAVGCPIWAVRAPGGYARWREPVMSAVRVAIQGQPIIPEIAINSLRGLSRWQQHGVLARLGGGVLSGLHVPMFLGVMGPVQWALASRLPLPLHAVVHAVLLAFSHRRTTLLCSCEVVRQPSWQQPLHHVFTAVDLFSFPWVWLTGTTRTPAALSPESECWVLASAVQIMVGYVLPTVVVAVWECQDFERFRDAAGGRYKSGWRTWLYERTTAAPVEGGWVRGGKLALMSWCLFGTVWDILKQMSMW